MRVLQMVVHLAGKKVVCVGAAAVGFLACALTYGEPTPVIVENPRAVIKKAMRLQPLTGKAKNVILFIGDGMGVATVTAARILEGQQRGKTGEENLLSFERLPYSALIKTYNTNQQTPDSAGTASAMLTGSKTLAGVLSISAQATRGDPKSGVTYRLETFLEIAELAGRSTGIVTTTRVTHATPGACYAHTPERNWESDNHLSPDAAAMGFPDIARQLIEFDIGDGVDVILGGGRAAFLPQEVSDPEEPEVTGWRLDGRNLITEWSTKKRSAYVWNKKQFDAVDLSTTDQLLGLFSSSHMAYEHDRPSDLAGEPSLAEMTSKAIDLLSKNPAGYFLMVEGGRIDHAHHVAKAFYALTDTIAFSDAVAVALKKIDRKETLVIVTADHSHVFTMGGYATRGNPIVGKVIQNDEHGKPNTSLATDNKGLPYTTLGYANGPGVTGENGNRPDLNAVDTTKSGFQFECTVPMLWETHGGEDVALYADGPYAHLFRGVLEQNLIFHVMVEAMGLATDE